MPRHSDYGLITDLDCWMHEAWPSFMETMEGRLYGESALNAAWAFFKAGWRARDKDKR